MEADFIVVGAGSAGCIVATRLAEAGYKIAMLEAGGSDTNPLIHIPAGVRFLINDPKVAWQDMTEPNTSAGNKAHAWPHGKVIGGSGSINGMLYVRGMKSDYDQWAQTGARGWDFDSILPYLKSIENFKGEGKGAEHRGSDGPISVVGSPYILPITRAFVSAAQAAGHIYHSDINIPEPDGVGFAQMNRSGRFRNSSARAFLTSAKLTGNLQIITNAMVTRLEIKDRICTGVTYLQNGSEKTISARKEVILSAGAIGSPHILQLSGVGPAQHLQDIGIGVAQELKGVGANLMDHYGARVVYRVSGTSTVNELARFPRIIPQVLRYFVLGDGVLSAGVSTAIAFCRSHDDLSFPDLQISFTPLSFDRNKFGVLEKLPGASVTATLARPRSRGSVMIKSSDPQERPRINSNYLADPNDVDVLIAGIGKIRKIASQAPLNSMLDHETMPEQNVTDDMLANYVRENGSSIFHPTGTCKMGIDENAVVDAQLKVHKISGLRVVDASIMPVITSGNTNVPTMMIAEKAAAMIIAGAR